MDLHRQHRISGIIAALIFLLFCLSGLALNHPSLIAGMEVSRRVLPPWYTFNNWSGGLLRGSIPAADGRLLLYGANGVWLADTLTASVTDFNTGLPGAASARGVRRMVRRSDGFYLVTSGAAYRLAPGASRWRRLAIPAAAGEALADITARGDTLVVAGRSRLYVSTAAGEGFSPLELRQAEGRSRQISLFRTVWMLHSGALFGPVGVAVVDFAAMVLLLLAVTGLLFTILRRRAGRLARRHLPARRCAGMLRRDLHLHDSVGALLLLLLVAVTFTGWCLRPPLMVPLALVKTPPPPATTLSHPNPWHDALRMTRFDPQTGLWMLHASDGIYTLSSLDAVPQPVTVAPPVSVMGLTVWEPADEGGWLCGSFSGMYHWDPRTGRVTDHFTGLPPVERHGPPVGVHAISGYSRELGVVVDHFEGASSPLPQPRWMRHLPMSLAAVALEAHSGRLIAGHHGSLLLIPLAGIAALWCLLSGHCIHHRRHHRRH